MSANTQEANAILSELQRLYDEASSLIKDAASGHYYTEDLQQRLAALKTSIKEGAKFETLARRKQAKTELEQCFFGPAMRSASANFRMKTHTNPKSGAWAAGLHEVEFELSYVIHNLREFLSESA